MQEIKLVSKFEIIKQIEASSGNHPSFPSLSKGGVGNSYWFLRRTFQIDQLPKVDSLRRKNKELQI